MELTPRQKVVLSEAVDLYRESNMPFHYSELAHRLGVSNSTTYDILKVLEQKGMVSSEYATPKMTSGPGRSSIRFFPAEEAIELFSHLGANDAEQDEWERVKAHILASLRGGAPEYRELLRELLQKTPKARSPLIYCGEAIATLLLSLRVIRYKFSKHDPINTVVSAPVSKMRMNAMAGFALGQLLANKVGRRFAANFQSHTWKYEAALRELSDKNLTALHKFTKQVLGIITAERD
jgi:DNA-binding MarR family transcriptional regulator